MNEHDIINKEIMDNELAATDWELWGFAHEINWWVHFFQAAFFKDEPVPMPVISYQKTRITTLGHYRLGRNSIGIKQNINLNRAHLGRPLWGTLSTLLHEMTHAWEYTYLPDEDRTKNWYHKNGFRDKLGEFGVITNEKGVQVGIRDPFVHILRQHGISFGENRRPASMTIPVKDHPRPKGKSKLKKWSCGCTNVRVAIKDFHAVCLKCGGTFQKQ